MPAIQLTRLKHQVEELTQHFEQPIQYVLVLHELLDFYADRTRHPGQAGAPPPLLPAYRVPTPVLRHIIRGLSPLVPGNPQSALELADALWAEDFLECRHLAIYLLQLVPVDNPLPQLQRLVDWAKPNQEEQLVTTLLTDGIAHLWPLQEKKLLDIVASWLKSSDAGMQILGLRALRALVENTSFHNLPVVFRLLELVIKRIPAEVRPFVLDLVQALIRRSAAETAFFLQQDFTYTHEPGRAWLIRQTLDLFPTEIQSDLRKTLKSQQTAST